MKPNGPRDVGAPAACAPLSEVFISFGLITCERWLSLILTEPCKESKIRKRRTKAHFNRLGKKLVMVTDARPSIYTCHDNVEVHSLPYK